MKNYMSPSELAKTLQKIIKAKDESVANECLSAMYNDCPVADFSHVARQCFKYECPFKENGHCFLMELRPRAGVDSLLLANKENEMHIAPDKFGAFYLLCLQKHIKWEQAPKKVKDKLQRITRKTLEKI